MQNPPTSDPLGTLYNKYLTRSDIDTLGRLFDQLAPKLQRIAARLNTDEHDAADAVQETFLALLDTGGTFNKSRTFMPWVIGILVNKSRGLGRAKHRGPGLPVELSGARELAHTAQPKPEDELADAELESSIRAAISDLPSTLREVVHGRLILDVPSKSLAAEHGISEGSVRTRLHRGRELLRNALRPAAATWLGAIVAGWFRTPASLAATRQVVLERAASRIATAGRSAVPAVPQSGLATQLLLAVTVTAAVFAANLNTGDSKKRPSVGPMDSESLTEMGAEVASLTDPKPARIRATAAASLVANPTVALTVHTAWIGTDMPVANQSVQLQTSFDKQTQWQDAITDKAGNAVFDIPKGTRVNRIRTQPTETTTGASAYIMEAPANFGAGDLAKLTLKIGAGGSLSGKVLDQDDLPVPFAIVQAWCGQVNHMQGEPTRTTQADAQGHFSLNHMGPTYVATAHTDRLVCSKGLRGRIFEGQTAKGSQIRLAPGITRSGIVLDPAGNPVPGAHVGFTNGLNNSSSSRDNTSISGTTTFNAGHGETFTLADGTFSVARLSPYNASPFVKKAPFKQLRASYPRGASNPEEPLTITLPYGDELGGVVVDRKGDPVPGARISVFPYGGSSTSKKPVFTDAEGRFHVIGMDIAESYAHTLGVFAQADGHALAFEQPVKVTSMDLVLHMAEERQLAGRILDLGGTPVPGLHLSIMSERMIDREYEMAEPATPEFTAGIAKVHTNHLGEFKFKQLNQGPLKLIVKHPSYSKAHVTHDIAADQESIDIDFDEADFQKVIVRGQVTDAHTGEPLEQAGVSVSLENQTTFQRTALTNATGHFEIVGLMPGLRSFYAQTDGYVRSAYKNESLAEGEHHLDFSLLPARSLHLTVIDTQGAAIIGSRISAIDSKGGTVSFTNGTFGTASQVTLVSSTGSVHGFPAEPITLQVRAGERTLQVPFDLSEPIPERQTIVMETAQDWAQRARPTARISIFLFRAVSQLTRSEHNQHFDLSLVPNDREWFDKQTQAGQIRAIESTATLTFSTSDGQLIATTRLFPLSDKELEENEQSVGSYWQRTSYAPLHPPSNKSMAQAPNDLIVPMPFCRLTLPRGKVKVAIESPVHQPLDFTLDVTNDQKRAGKVILLNPKAKQ